MGQRREVLIVYAAGAIQGVALVTFPAASAVFTSPSDYGLSSTEYGGMFVPQAIMAIISSLLGAGLRNRLGTKRIYLLGLLANLLAMTLLAVSRFVLRQHGVVYEILLLATACMGIGFGFTVPALLPLSISFGQKELTSIAASVAGGLIAFYQIGYGVAAFGVGPLQTSASLPLNTIYGCTAIVALAMCGLSFVVTRKSYQSEATS
jgi:MFS family permease